MEKNIFCRCEEMLKQINNLQIASDIILLNKN